MDLLSKEMVDPTHKEEGARGKIGSRVNRKGHGVGGRRVAIHTLKERCIKTEGG